MPRPSGSDAAARAELDRDTVPWSAMRDEVAGRLAAAGLANSRVEAGRLVGEVAGLSPAELAAGGGGPASVRGVARLDAMVERRLAGEPLQYVLGRWGFRTLDLLVDDRVLIPRPETEGLVDHVLAAIDGAGVAPPDVLGTVNRAYAVHSPENGGDLGPVGVAGGLTPVVVDLGTGSGAIALSVVAERPGIEVWASDCSADALAVARANLAGLGGRAAAKVRLVAGDWFAALPTELAGRIDVVAANPPYVAERDPLPAEVADWEPAGSLVSGPSGREAIQAIVADAPRWLAPDGMVVIEIGETQGHALTTSAREAGFAAVAVHGDLAGRDRYLVGCMSAGRLREVLR